MRRAQGAMLQFFNGRLGEEVDEAVDGALDTLGRLERAAANRLTNGKNAIEFGPGDLVNAVPAGGLLRQLQRINIIHERRARGRGRNALKVQRSLVEGITNVANGIQGGGSPVSGIFRASSIISSRPTELGSFQETVSENRHQTNLNATKNSPSAGRRARGL